MSLLDHSQYRQNDAAAVRNPRIALVASDPLTASSYHGAPGVEPVRIRTLRHHPQRTAGMYIPQPAPEIPFSYADFLHLGPLPAAIEPAQTDVPALPPARLPQLV
jgi:hypothetical protein